MTGSLTTIAGRGSPALPWFRGPRPHLGRFADPFADFPIPPTPPAARPVVYRVVIPHLISLEVWADQMIACFPTAHLPRLMDERDWQEWGELVIGRAPFTQFAVPTPRAFSDWRSWAEALILALPYGT